MSLLVLYAILNEEQWMMISTSASPVTETRPNMGEWQHSTSAKSYMQTKKPAKKYHALKKPTPSMNLYDAKLWSFMYSNKNASSIRKTLAHFLHKERSQTIHLRTLSQKQVNNNWLSRRAGKNVVFLNEFLLVAIKHLIAYNPHDTALIYSAINYMERYLLVYRTDPVRFQLLGAACMFLAVKLNQPHDHHVSVDEFLERYRQLGVMIESADALLVRWGRGR